MINIKCVLYLAASLTGFRSFSQMAGSPAKALAPSREITVDCRAQGEPLQPFWAYFGYDEPNYTYMKDGKKLLSEIAALSPVPVYVRCHNLLTTGDGTPALKWGSTNAYTEDEKGNPVYDWHIVDSIFDTYIQRGMKPLAEIGFMPEALSTHPHPYRHYWKPGVKYDSIYTGWAYPPTDYKKWRELVHRWVLHSIQRYGEKEVSSWLWEVWNEPNISYWKATEEDYYKIYDYAADAVKRALPQAQIGGPATTGPGGGKAAAWLLLRHYRIDNEHSNAYTAWKKMGSPQTVSDEQYKELEKTGQLELLGPPEQLTLSGGTALIRFSLPRQGVSLLQLSY